MINKNNFLTNKTMQFTGIIKQAFDYREGVSQRTNQPWQTIKVLVEEDTDAQYKNAFIFDVWRLSLIEWINNNIGAKVTIDFEARVEEYNSKYYQHHRAVECVYNNVRVGVEPTAQPQDGNANGAEPQGRGDDLPF